MSWDAFCVFYSWDVAALDPNLRDPNPTNSWNSMALTITVISFAFGLSFFSSLFFFCKERQMKENWSSRHDNLQSAAYSFYHELLMTSINNTFRFLKNNMRVNLTQNSSYKHSRFHFCTQQRITKAQRANINDTHGIDGSPRTYRDHQRLQFIEVLLLFILVIVDRLDVEIGPSRPKAQACWCRCLCF